MNRKALACYILVPFSIFSFYCVYKVGYLGLFDYHRHSPAGWQVFADLVIACSLILAWLIPEAKRKGRNPWPYVVLTLVAGSIGPLAYLALGSTKDQS